jgi:hypothetical protein
MITIYLYVLLTYCSFEPSGRAEPRTSRVDIWLDSKHSSLSFSSTRLGPYESAKVATRLELGAGGPSATLRMNEVLDELAAGSFKRRSIAEADVINGIELVAASFTFPQLKFQYNCSKCPKVEVWSQLKAGCGQPFHYCVIFNIFNERSSDPARAWIRGQISQLKSAYRSTSHGTSTISETLYQQNIPIKGYKQDGRAQGREDSTGRKLPFYWTFTCSKYISSYRLCVGYAPSPDSRIRTWLRIYM